MLHQGGSLIKIEEKSSLSSIRPHCELCKVVMKDQQRESVTKTTNCRPWLRKWRERDWPGTLLKLPVRDKLSYSRRTLVRAKEWQLKSPTREDHARCTAQTTSQRQATIQQNTYMWTQKNGIWGPCVEMEVRLQWMRDRLAATIIADKTRHAACIGLPHKDKIPAYYYASCRMGVLMLYSWW